MATSGESSSEMEDAQSPAIPQSSPEKPLISSIPSAKIATTTVENAASWIDDALRQALVYQNTILETLDSTIDASKSRLSQIRDTSLAHTSQTIDSLKDIASEYNVYEHMVFGKIKDGVNVAASHPLISGTLAFGVGIFALKKTRRFVYHNTLRMFLSEEALLSRADLKVKELRQSMDRLIAEGQKLEIFKHFSSLDVEDVTDVKSGYSITFHFSPNPYFEDGKLTKIYNFLEEGTTKITTTSIQWKEGKSLPNGVNHEKKGNKRALPEESFFTWFRDAQHKEDNEEEIQDEIADIINEDLWPNPLTYFNNVADEEDFEGDDGNERKEGNSDEDDNDEEEEDGEE